MAGENKIHVNKKTGKSGICDAKIQCPLGDDTPHFRTQAEANAYISAVEAEQNDTFSTVSKGSAKKQYSGPSSQQLLDRQRLREEIPQQELTHAAVIQEYNNVALVRNAFELGNDEAAFSYMGEHGLDNIIDPTLDKEEIKVKLEQRESELLGTARSLAADTEKKRAELRAIPPRSQEAILADMKRASKDLDHRAEVLREVQEEARPWRNAEQMFADGATLEQVEEALDEDGVLEDLRGTNDQEVEEDIRANIAKHKGEVAMQSGYFNSARENLDKLKVEEKKARLGADKVDDTPLHPGQAEEMNDLQNSVATGDLYKSAMKRRGANDRYELGLREGQQLAREAMGSYNRRGYNTQDTLNTMSDRLQRDKEQHLAEIKEREEKGKRSRDEILRDNGKLEALERTKRSLDMIRDRVGEGDRF